MKTVPIRLLIYIVTTVFTFIPIFSIADNSSKLHLESGENKVALIELYTSEGCSSCPDADDWFSSLKSSSDLWKKFVPIGFHVDYWNSLGWTDPYSRRENTFRQQLLAQGARFYTPEFFVNGSEWRARSVQLIAGQNKRVGNLTVDELSDSGAFKVIFKPSTNEKLNLVLFASTTLNNVETKVTAGENSGRKLLHDFVSTELVTSSMELENGTYSANVVLKRQKGANANVVFWVSESTKISPIQAVGGKWRSQ